MVSTVHGGHCFDVTRGYSGAAATIVMLSAVLVTLVVDDVGSVMLISLALFNSIT